MGSTLWTRCTFHHAEGCRERASGCVLEGFARLHSDGTADTSGTRGTAAVAVPAEPVANPTYTDTARVDSITQAT